MRLIRVIILALLLIYQASFSEAEEDNEFAEFEDDEMIPLNPPPPVASQRPTTVSPPKSKDSDKSDDATNFDEDFGLEGEDEDEMGEKPSAEKENDAAAHGGIKAQPLKFADVPAHFRSNWGSYQVEALVLFLLSVYMLNYLAGRAANQAIAFSWVAAHRDTLESQFSVVGDDGLSDVPSSGQLQRETDCTYGMWCTGRVGCNGSIIHVKTKKRHDLLSRIWGLFNPQHDRVIITMDMEPGELDTFVVAVGQRKATARLHKEFADLAQFTIEKKSTANPQGLPPSFALYSESSEVATCLLDPGILSLFRKYEHSIEYIHISDQYSGSKPPEGETLTKLPDVQRIMTFSFLLQNGEEDKQGEEELLHMVFYLLDKMRRFRMSREGKIKADKRRQNVQEAFLKTSHQARQEAAQARREEKTRERKQRLLEEEDPEKQRRLERLEMKRESKAKQPKMKQLKMKA